MQLLQIFPYFLYEERDEGIDGLKTSILFMLFSHIYLRFCVNNDYFEPSPYIDPYFMFTEG